MTLGQARLPGRAGRAVLLAAACAAPLAALADRHCYPASDEYFMARQAVLDDGNSTSEALARAAEHLDTAIADAAICGCRELADALAPLHETLNASAQPALGRQAILDAEAEVNRAVAACHG